MSLEQWPYKIPMRFKSLFRRPRLDAELDEELQYHLDRQIEYLITQGMDPTEARYAALRAVGGVTQRKEQCVEARSVNYIENFIQDLRYALRVIRLNPGFAAAAVLTLALGIGANTAIFSVVYGVLLRPLPYENGDRLVVLHQQAKDAKLANIPFSAKEVFDYRDQNHTLDAVVEHHSMAFLLIGDDSAERVGTAVVSANFFDALGVKPIHGRTFVPSDEAHGSEAVLILANKYWQTRYNSDPNIVGKMFQMNNRPHRVIGVLPALPQYPIENDVYMPTSQCPTRSSDRFKQNRQARMMTVFGRLKPGVSLPQAQADLNLIASRLEQSYPEDYPKQSGYGMNAVSLHEDLTGKGRQWFLLLLAAAGFVLFIACANVANLFLSRLLKLERELALRVALGANRMRLVRQLTTESMLLSLCGGLLGIAIAPLTTNLLVKFSEQFTTRAAEVRIDYPVMIFALLLSLVAGLLFGLAPAITSSRAIDQSLRQGGRSTGGSARGGLRGALVLAQVAISLVLLIGAGLMIRSFLHLRGVNPGFSTERLLTMRISANFTRYSTAQQAKQVFEEILRSAESTPGVSVATLTSNVPLSKGSIAAGPGNVSFELEGNPAGKNELKPLVDITTVSTRYFETIKQPLINGRLFTDFDDEKALPVAVVNQTMARHRWPNMDPSGKRITFDSGMTWTTIVGVVTDAKEYGLDKPISDEIYLPMKQSGFANALIVRSASDPMRMLPAIRDAIRKIDPQLAIDQIATLENLEHESVAAPRLVAALLSIFASLALLLSASGIASVMALSVSQRKKELGIRMALGEQSRSILMMVVRQGLLLAVCGIAIGLAGAFGLSRLMRSLLFETSPADPMTFAAVSLLFLIVAALASFIPARQVTLIDPIQVLRQE